MWPPHERLIIGTSEGNRRFLFQDVPVDGNCFFHCFIVAIGGGHNSASCRSFPQYSAMNINVDQPSYHCRSANTETI